MDLATVVRFATVSLVIVVVPGPSVLLAIGRALSAGRRAALLVVLGNAAGLFVQVLFIALGLELIVSSSDTATTLLRTLGAAYLAWLGLAAIRGRHETMATHSPATTRARFAPCRDGLVVGATNPKSLLLLAPLLWRYVEPGAGPGAVQVVVLGAVFCVVAVVGDGAWALLAARARRWFASDARHLDAASIAGGVMMIGLAVWLVVE